MSAVPAQKPEEAPEASKDADGWALLEGLRRRLDDQAAQGRKTQAQVSQLADSIGALVAQQRRRSLWLNVNSFVAYLMFTVLCGAGFYLLYRSRAHELAVARDHAITERDAAVRRADDAAVRAVAREAAGARAWEVFQLLEAGKRAEAATKLDALRDQPLSRTERAVLAARVHDTQAMEVDTALKAAAAAFKAGRPGDVIKPLEAALAGEPAGPRAAMIHYYLGVAYAKTELDKATSHLQAAIVGNVEQEDARFQLASVLDRSGAYASARAEYDRFATAHPQSQLAMFALRRSAALARIPAGGAPRPSAGPAPGAAPAPMAPAVPLPRAVAPRPAVPATGAGAPAAPRPGAAPSPATARPGAPANPAAVQPAAPRPVAPANPATGGASPAAPRPVAPGGASPAAPRPVAPANPAPGAAAPVEARPGAALAPRPAIPRPVANPPTPQQPAEPAAGDPSPGAP